MEQSFMRKTFSCIAKGFVEKERMSGDEPSRYPYSRTLQHGINMFLAASVEAGCPQYAALYGDEASFLKHFASLPISDWFEGWDPAFMDEMHIRDEAFYGCEAFAYARSHHVFTPTSDCYDFLDIQDSDIINGTDEHLLFEKMVNLDEEHYCQIRKYIIEHPIISEEDYRTMFRDLADCQEAQEAFRFAYEEITEDFYRCPCCGWTMTKGKYGYSCHSVHCTDVVPELTEDQKIKVSERTLLRLKKGVMRYFAAPGKWELEIADFCRKKKLRWQLWPQKDRYDVEIHFPDGEVWEVDAKAYRNPVLLRAKIQHDNGFPEGNYAKGFFAIPTEYAKNFGHYTQIINRSLTDPKVKCITVKALKTEITRKEKACHEENA